MSSNFNCIFEFNFNPIFINFGAQFGFQFSSMWLDLSSIGRAKFQLWSQESAKVQFYWFLTNFHRCWLDLHSRALFSTVASQVMNQLDSHRSFQTMYVIRHKSSLWTPRADSRTRCAPQCAGGQQNERSPPACRTQLLKEQTSLGKRRSFAPLRGHRVSRLIDRGKA